MTSNCLASEPDVRPKHCKGIESVEPDSSILDLDIIEYQSVRPTAASSKTMTIDLSRPPLQLEAPFDKNQFSVTFTQSLPNPNQLNQSRAPMPQSLCQPQQVRQLNQPVLQTTYVSGTEHTQILRGLFTPSRTTGYNHWQCKFL